MKIAIYHNLPSGGAKRALYEQIKHTKAHHEYHLYRFDFDANESYLDLRPMVKEVFNYSLGDNFRFSALRDLRKIDQLQRKIAADIDAAGYDLVYVTHCQFTQSPGVLKYLATPSLYYIHEPRRQDYEYNISAHNVGSFTGPKGALKQMANKRVHVYDVESARSSTRQICNSYFTQENILRSYGLYAQVCYQGIDSQLFQVAKSRPDMPYVLSVGAIDPFKGHMLTLEALSNISKQYQPKFVIVADRGAERHRAELQSLASNRGVDLDIQSQVTDSELTQLYGQASMVVCAAELEPFGLTPLESMACGTPVVAIRQGGYKETVVEGVNGWFADQSVASLSQVIADVLSGSKKPELSGQKLHDYVAKQWSWQSGAKNLEAAYQSFMELP